MNSSIVVEAPVPEQPAQTQQQQQVYSATGVPQVQLAPAFNPTPYQKKVKMCSKLMVCSSMCLMVMGVFTILGNVLYMLSGPSSFELKFIDFDGQKIDYYVDLSALSALALIKMVTGIIMYKFGKRIYSVFKPILVDYRNAEQGVTEGIQMTKRISKDMLALKRIFCKTFAACTCLNFLMGFMFISFAYDQADNYLEMKYSWMAEQGNSDPANFTVPAIPSSPPAWSDEKAQDVDDIPSSWWQPPQTDKDGYFDLSKIASPADSAINIDQEQLDEFMKQFGLN